MLYRIRVDAKLRFMKISIVGLGKIGLPFAVQAASKGHNVYGCDVNQTTVDLINSAKPPFPGESNLDERLTEVIDSGNLTASTKTAESVNQSDVVVVLVPVVVDAFGEPDFNSIDKATEEIAKGLQPGTLVCYETTLPVGTTRNRFGVMLEKKSGLKCGEEFFLAFSPERISSGTAFRDFAFYPKIVGGVNQKSESRAVLFYESVFDFSQRKDLATENGVWAMGSSEASELAKLAETTYRDVNIGLSNQFATYAERIGVDIYKVIEACNSQPFSHIHQPGIAVGGHCIPVYPHFYLEGDPDATIVRSARISNKSVPTRMINLLEDHFGSLEGKRIVILGLAYRAGVKEHAFSGAKDLVKEAKAKGATPLLHDPMYSDTEIENLGFEPYRLGNDCDAVVLHTAHTEYGSLEIESLPGAEILIDGRNFLPELIKGKVKTFVLGRGFAATT
jgi:nucleotide sugar dehydrogenase